MASKTIVVSDAAGKERKKMLSSDHGYARLLAEFQVSCLEDASGVEIQDFESLVNGCKYTLGPPLQEQQWQDQERNRKLDVVYEYVMLKKKAEAEMLL